MTELPPRAPSLWATIPAAVLFDKELRPNAKLIYGVISSLASAQGYCYATNAYIAALFDLTPKSVSEIISQLAARGHVYVDLPPAQPGTTTVRKIWITGTRLGFEELPSATPPKNREGSPGTSGGGVPKNREGGPEKSGGGVPKNREQIYKYYNNTPYNPQGGERFDAFWDRYPRKIDKQKARRSFEKLNVDDALLRTMLTALENQKASPQWTKDSGAYIPHPTTWLNNRRWEAETQSADSSATLPMSAKKMGGVEQW